MPRLRTSQLVNDVYSRLENNTLFYPQSEVIDAINQGLFIINLFTGSVGGTISIPGNSIAGRVIYSTPDGIIIPLAVTFDSKQLEKVSFDRLSDYDINVLTQDVSRVARPVYQWSPIGLTKFAIYPADNIGNRSLSVTGIAEITKLSSLNDPITIGNEAATAVCDYASHILQAKLGGQPFVDSLKSFANFNKFVQLNKLWEVESQPTFDVSKETTA